MDYQRPRAGNDTKRDESLTELSAFSEAVELRRQLPQFVRAFGSEHDSQAALQFVYGYLTCADNPGIDEAAFGETWDAFIDELNDPNWTYVSFANLRSFHSEDALIDFGDGISIRHRSLEEIRDRLGWDDWHFRFLQRDWQDGHPRSEHVLSIETVTEEPKYSRSPGHRNGHDDGARPAPRTLAFRSW